MLSSADWQLITYASRKYIGPIIKGQAVEEVCLTLNLETRRPETSVTTNILCVTSKKNDDLIYTGVEAGKNEIT